MRNIRIGIKRWSGWLVFILFVVSIISGLGWDIRTSDLIRSITGGLVNRATSADLHVFVTIPTVLLILFHIILKPRISQAKK